MEDQSAKGRRSRRNLIKIGAIAASAMLSVSTRTTPADAALCAAAIGCKCFLKGTTVRTADGDRTIENLAVGDLLPTAFGGMCRIQWIGRYPFRKSDPTKAWVKDVLPVRIARSALGPDIPCADLYV